jgi:branched-chain amino acid transport system substrate-binding protein
MEVAMALSSPVKLISSLTRSGSSVGQSDSVVNSIMLRLEDSEYRVAGTEIRYQDLDDGTPEHGSWLAEKERENARYAATDPDVLAYIGTLDADAAPHSIPILNAAGPLLMISPCNTYPGLTKPVPWAPEEPDVYYPTGVRNYARTALTDDLQAIAAAAWASELGIEGVYVLHDTEPYGRGVAEPFAAACSQRGLSVLAGPEGIEPKARDFTALAARIAATAPDAVYYGGIIQNGAGPLWRDIREALPGVQMIAPDAIFERAFLADAGSYAEGTLITFGGVPPAQLDGAGREFYERYKRVYDKEPESYAAATYDACGVVLDAIEQVGTKERAMITEAVLATRDHDGLLGRWSFDPNGDITLRRTSRLTVKKGDFAFLSVFELNGDSEPHATGNHRN